MDALSTNLIKKLNLSGAVKAEAAAWRNVLPPEPWQPVLAANTGSFAKWVSARLEQGATNAPGVVVNVRKARQAFRPVMVVGIAERIAYRALVDHLLAGIELEEREYSNYVDFVTGPIEFAVHGHRFFTPHASEVKYVIQADVAAFYEYVDHSVLLNELQVRTLAIEPADHLVHLLGEMQGRPFGIPQLLDPSDRLSELYISVLHRDLVRRGANVWHYNDDFRLTAKSYAEAQDTLELVAAGAREIGLSLNDSKTYITKFDNYFWQHWNEEESEGDVEFRPEMIVVGSGDYGKLEEDEAVEFATSVIGRIDSENEDAIDLRQLDAAGSRSLRRALGILERAQSDAALHILPKVFEFAPEISHRVCEYMLALWKAEVPIGDVWDEILGGSSNYSAWQRLWLVYVGRQTSLFSDQSRRTWLESQLGNSQALLRAEVALALAPYGLVEFAFFDQSIRTQPEALVPWYALAAAATPGVDATKIRALRGSSTLLDLLLKEVA